ncbi:hypothetical protein RZS08_18200, partial [Arthrospira platensis SPKY1]|nr:hypothetical protein [Arthrospira platensis SPKY1]
GADRSALNGNGGAQALGYVPSGTPFIAGRLRRVPAAGRLSGAARACALRLYVVSYRRLSVQSIDPGAIRSHPSPVTHPR